MSAPKSEFLRTMIERGFFHQATDLEGLDAAMQRGMVTAYIGIDCTADSLHIGNLVGVMVLRHLQRAGHRPISLIGGGTTRVGDPSGRDDSRRLLSEADIARNAAGIRRSLAKFIRFGAGKTDAFQVNNADWLDKLEYIAFLRDYGRHFSVNRMLSFDSVKLRLEREQPMSFLEFNYMILQAYDFLELARRHDCRLQMGGSDQWGNIVNGVELGRRVDNRELFGLTTPLITTTSGAKMGKSAERAIWLNEDRLSAYDYWQYWRNTEDADVGRFLRLFTELPLAEIGRLEQLQGQEINEAKKVLAFEATALCHGRAAAEAAAETARRTFEEGRFGEDLKTGLIAEDQLRGGQSLILQLMALELTKSTSEARRLVRSGAVRVNDQQVTDELRKLTLDDLNPENVIKLSVGKKRHALLRVGVIGPARASTSSA
ncbi:MAG: tyrosine--tRNA ligase [Proteobacteria bacterium]|nr:tyrosine--tRNA ligase [Pseudomonadota bacterium]MBI3496674.1 tyrosine--tRNA ligase [Pseudomonadota bacterium]